MLKLIVHSSRASSVSSKLFRMAVFCGLFGIGIETATGQLIARLDTDARVNSLAFAPDGESLAAACGKFAGLLQQPSPGKVVIWDVAKQKIRATVAAHADGVSCAVFSANGQMLATAGYDGAIKLWNPVAGRSLEGFDAKIGPIMAIAFSSDASRLVAGGWRGNQEHATSEFAVWDVPSRKLIATVPAHKDAISSALFLPDNQAIVTGSDDGTVKLWSTDKFQELRVVGEHVGSVHSMAISPDGTVLAVASGDFFSAANPKTPAGGVKLWNTRNWREAFSLSLPEVVFSVAFSPDGNLLAVAGTGPTIRLLDVSGQEQTALRGHVEPLRAVCFSPDSKLLVAGGSDGIVQLWQLPKERHSSK